MKALETKDTKGLFFLVGEDFQACPSLKSEAARKSFFAILRHFQKIKEVRGPGPILRYAVRPNFSY